MLRDKDGLLKTDFKTPLGKVSYHIPCHSRVQNIGQKTREVLEWVPGTTVNTVERCSGPRRHLGREERIFRGVDEDRQAGVQADGEHRLPIGSAPIVRSPAARSSRGSASRSEPASPPQEHPVSLIRIAYGSSEAPCGIIGDGPKAKSPRHRRDSLLTLEAYAKARTDFRARVIAHKKRRAVHLGDHLTLLFEDELTVRYQIQEMLRIEKTFEEQRHPGRARCLQPAGSRRQQLESDDAGRSTRTSRSAESRYRSSRASKTGYGCGSPKAAGLRDRRRGSGARERREDLGRAFRALRAFPREHRPAQTGAELAIGVDHPAYTHTLAPVPDETRKALLEDLA